MNALWQALTALSAAVLHFFGLYPLPAIFVLLTIEEAGIPLPVPGDALLFVAGAQHQRAVGFSLAVIGVATAAIFLGSSLLYALMRRGGRTVLIKYGKFVRLHPQRVERMEQWFLRRGRIAVILGRLIPGLRIPTTIMAGLSGMPYHRYASSALIAALIWSGAYYLLGWAAGRAWPLLVAGLADALDDVPRAVLLLGALLTLLGAIGGTTLQTWRRRHRVQQAHG